MKAEDFHYDLPPGRIAQAPLPERSSSKLLVIGRADGGLEDASFSDLPRLLGPGDLLVINDTRVRPRRLRGVKTTGGRVELTMVGRIGEDWECLIKGGAPRPGLAIKVGPDARAVVLADSGGAVRTSADQGAPLWRVRIEGQDAERLFEQRGLPPLPPYIRRDLAADPALDHERYQTVYAREGEAAAAPTAGLHLTDELLERLGAAGVEIARLRLDVSFGTFAPVLEERVEDHVMHAETYELPDQTAAAVERTRRAGGRVVAVGTTVARTLEHAALADGTARPGAGETSLFILPGFRFQVIDALITNFHLPGSTLIMLAAAFAGREQIMKAYRHALAHGYRFLSYGDATLIR